MCLLPYFDIAFLSESVFSYLLEIYVYLYFI